MTPWTDCSTPGFPVLQFSSVQPLSRVRLFATPWIAAHQASLSITNSRSSLKLPILRMWQSKEIRQLGSYLGHPHSACFHRSHMNLILVWNFFLFVLLPLQQLTFLQWITKLLLLISAAITCTFLDMTRAGSIPELAKSEKKVNSQDLSPPKCFFL